MFSDTHFHFYLIVNDRGLDGVPILTDLAARNTLFALDIGTAHDDLEQRQQFAADVINRLPAAAAYSAKNFLFFSAGIWPSPEEIKNRAAAVKELERQICAAQNSKNALFRKVCAIGECGLDHHWNPSGTDGRCETDFDAAMIHGESELFCMQIELAKRFSLPVIIHSRDAFDDTINCIKTMGYDRGVIHCYSYGVKEARAFLDRGWYISFSGSITYTKKTHREEIEELLRFVPEDRILIETDAPYLAPVPFRGQPNTPVLIEETYKYAGAARSCSPEYLSNVVDTNAAALFTN